MTINKLWQNRKERKELARRLRSEDPGLEVVHPNAAGVDVGNSAHYVAVRPDRDSQPVRRFECFTADLNRLADWLESCGVKTVALQSTGVYWILSVRHSGRTRLRGLPGECTAHQELARTQERCAGKPVAAEIAHLRIAQKFLTTNFGDSGPSHLLAATGRTSA